MTLSNILNKVKIQNKHSDNFLHSTTSDKGIPYLPYYWKFTLKGRKPIINPGESIFNWIRQYLAHADDIVILTRNIDSFNEVLYQLQMEVKLAGLAINHNKIELMKNIKNYTNNTSKVILNNVPYM